MSIAYLINSAVEYTAPLEMLFDSLAPQTNTIYIVAGGAKEYTHSTFAGVPYITVTHRSYDYTGLIELLDKDIPETHVFCLQDTMIAGPQFTRLVETADTDMDAVAVFGGQCNLVLYSVEYLRRQRAFTEKMRNCSKKMSIDYEGHLWKIAPRKGHYPGTCECDFSIHYPYGPTPRIKEYYGGVDIIKYKANYGQTNEQKGYYLNP